MKLEELGAVREHEVACRKLTRHLDLGLQRDKVPILPELPMRFLYRQCTTSRSWPANRVAQGVSTYACTGGGPVRQGGL